MKNIAISVVVLFLMAGSVGCRPSGAQSEELVTVDVTASYSSKQELVLQDFMDVEYIPLETNDEFINQGFVQDVGKEIIVVRNRNSDGTIFVYDRTGKALRKINRKGGGGEEYTNLFSVTLDEDAKEMFVSDIYGKKIIVYDFYGNFKRSFKHKEGEGSLFYTDIFNYDKDQLICYDSYNEKNAFVLISKQDGSVTHEIKIPFKEKKQLWQSSSELNLTVSPGPYRTIIPYYNGNWILAEHSSDTVFQLLPDYSLRPFIARTPSIQSMNPGVFLNLRLLSSRYCFLETIENVYDFSTNRGFPRTFMMYDKQEGTVGNYIIYNGDFTTKKELYMSMARPVGHEIESWYPLEANQLVEAREKGELKGRLKEIAATLDEEDNPVIMLIKNRK